MKKIVSLLSSLFSNLIWKFKVKKSLQRSGVATIFSLLVVFSVISCGGFPSLNSQSVVLTDISNELTYRKLATQGFMGGSVFYNPDLPGAGQLAAGVHVAIRFGSLTKKTIDEEDVFSDIPEKEVIGYITVTSIDEESISFNCKLFNKNGEVFKTTDHNLDINQSVDVNGDSIPDLEYKKPGIERPGLESAIYLNFLSSQELLNTTMFSIIPSQYSRGVYPSGVLGINPYGKFVVEKYEGTSKNRSMVRGIVFGDYVLDSEKGIYQSISSNTNARNARNISDDELQDGESLTNKNFYFKLEEFTESMTPQSLLALLPTDLTSQYLTPVNAEEAVGVLNQILKMNYMIKNISEYRGEVLLPEELATINDTSSLAEIELVSLNRLYLGNTYSEVCPQVKINTNDITEVLPLASCTFTNIEDTIEEGPVSRGVAPTYGLYEKQRLDIENEFNKSYKRVFGLPFNKWLDYQNSIPRPGSLKVEFGIGGSFEITWSKVTSSLVIVTFIQAETVLQLGKDQELFNLVPPGVVKEVPLWAQPIPVGPIPFFFSVPLKFDAPIKAGGYADFSVDTFAGFTGLYGAGCSMGAYYGIEWKKWFKVWRKWVYRPAIYFNPYANPSLIGKTAFFVGLQGPMSQENMPFVFEGASAYITFSPYVAIGPRLSIGSYISGPYVEYQAKAGMDYSFTISTLPGVYSAVDLLVPDRFYLTANAKAAQNFRLGFVAGFKLELPIVGKKDLNFEFGDLVNYDQTLVEFKLF